VKAIGKYRARALLGEGSMGKVFLAHDPDLKRDVAVKVMAGSSGGDPKLRERFEREARAVARLHHPNIVTVHDLGHDENGAPFIAMEFLEGSDLSELAGARSLSLGDKLEILVQVCGGLAHAHQNGIVHRDIKPANIFVLKDGTAKIMDFGVARWMQTQKTQSGLVVGTAGYISPEQLRGKPVDGRADIFSLGVVLFEILTQEALFPGDTIETIFFKTLGKETPTIVAPNGRELPALQAVLKRALAKEVEARYRSADEMKQALRSLVDTQSTLLRETVPFATREPGASPKPGRRTSPSAPTRIVRVPSTAVRTRGISAPAKAGAFVLAAGALALYSFFVGRPFTSSSPPKPPSVSLPAPEPPPEKVDLAPEVAPPSPESERPETLLPPRVVKPAPRETTPPPEPTQRREFVEGRTQFTPDASSENEDKDDIMGFEAEPGIEVGETADSFLPAEILIEVSPEDAKPGERYVVRVSLFNAGYRPIRIASLELVSRFGDKTVGKGQPIPVVASEIAPQATAVIYEVAGTWKESLNEGEIETHVALTEGGTLTKRLIWRPAPR
jgi:serine/threonine-protein kinase